jgi:hypothetical protein
MLVLILEDAQSLDVLWRNRGYVAEETLAQRRDFPIRNREV